MKDWLTKDEVQTLPIVDVKHWLYNQAGSPSGDEQHWVLRHAWERVRDEE